ncbi:diguanylate cyclase domain-containing protein [Tardiphaga sp.]|jgi:diguanylate cyclase (GGDEF)-like protein/PAS domain S-box-containing protein|uniref:diguanylate cyclase n=1 Tax=Tardiphaga sp. TaxID=1926292 RepID=UPI0037D992CB
MAASITSTTKSASRLSAPGAIVAVFVLAMSACVLGLVLWKTIDARRNALQQSEIDIRNLAHSLQEHATHTFQAADVAMSGMVDLLKYQTPRPDRFNLFLVNTAKSLPQIREFGALDAIGEWRYSSLTETPKHNNSDRAYFAYHRDNTDPGLRISEPLQSRLTGRMTILLSKRVSDQAGNFNGVLVAAIDTDYFSDFFKTFDIGEQAGISLLRTDGIVLAHWPSMDVGKDLSGTQLFQNRLKESRTGFYRVASPFDGVTKYFGYEKSNEYPVIVTVAVPERKVLAAWRNNLKSDVAVAAVLLCSVILLAALLSTQFRFRLNMENALRERESRYRLLADNIADVVILLDRTGNFLYVSHSVEFVLGLDPKDLIGRSCLELVYPEDLPAVRAASARLTDRVTTENVVFRTYRDDRSIAWVEINFKLAERAEDADDKIEIVGVLRDVTQRKKMQDELTALNARLAELATTDGLTGLANRRTLDGFLNRAFAQDGKLSALLIDIDHFKGYNDTMGHQVGDDCLKRVASVLADATINTTALAARYGGEEFAIVLPDVDEASAMTVAETVRLRVRALEIPNVAAARGYLSVSIGVAHRTARSPNETVLLGEADLALYEAKRRGRDCVVTHAALEQDYFSAGFERRG